MTKIYAGSSSLYIFILLLLNTYKDLISTYKIYAATAEALEKWEKRFKLEKVKVEGVKEGRVTLNLEGVYLSEGKFININGVVV
ncbi:MAG: hypothetical protein ACR5LB_06295 [Wolbachia sp.]|uniref:hypothetical protein n=1 Tax=unclassified Wolbachia TaxID=2640676 RepID=UPI0022319AC2